MSIAETLKAAKAKLFHPHLNQGGRYEFICLAIEEVADDRIEACAAKDFLKFEMGVNLTGSHFIARVQPKDMHPYVEGERMAQQSARYTLLDAAIFIAEKRGV
jgi:hypothetical protein